MSPKQSREQKNNSALLTSITFLTYEKRWAVLLRRWGNKGGSELAKQTLYFSLLRVNLLQSHNGLMASKHCRTLMFCFSDKMLFH